MWGVRAIAASSQLILPTGIYLSFLLNTFLPFPLLGVVIAIIFEYRALLKPFQRAIGLRACLQDIRRYSISYEHFNRAEYRFNFKKAPAPIKWIEPFE